MPYHQMCVLYVCSCFFFSNIVKLSPIEISECCSRAIAVVRELASLSIYLHSFLCRLSQKHSQTLETFYEAFGGASFRVIPLINMVLVPNRAVDIIA